MSLKLTIGYLLRVNDKGNWYYKSNLVNIDDQTHVIQMWVKIAYSDNGKYEFLKTHKEDKYKDINRAIIKVLIDYQKRQWHADRVIYYSYAGNIIGSDELSVKKDDFISKTVGDKLLIKILADYNIKR